MAVDLFKMTGWKIFRPSRAPWGESTKLWTDADWDWFRTYRQGAGVPPLTEEEIADGVRR